MQYTSQDNCFSLQSLTEDPFFQIQLEHLDIPLEKSIKSIDRHLKKLHKNNVIYFNKCVNASNQIKYKSSHTNKTSMYQQLVPLFFKDYLKFYIERHNPDYDKLLILLKKLTHVDFNECATIKTITKCEDKILLLCAELSTEKQKWKTRTYNVELRLFEFELPNSREYHSHTPSPTQSHSSSDSDDVESTSVSGCGCCDECHHDCQGECGCLECNCNEDSVDSIAVRNLNIDIDEHYCTSSEDELRDDGKHSNRDIDVTIEEHIHTNPVELIERA